MSDISRLVIILCITGGVTLLFREMPFLLFRHGKIPSLILYLGKVLPMAIMSILVLYCIKDTSFSYTGGYLPQLVSLAVVAALHIWKRNTTLSIFAGTLVYMFSIRLL